MSNLKMFVMELRPQLQSCNVYIKFKKKIDKNTEINLKSNEIIITSSDIKEIIPILTLKIIPSSISCLQIISNSVSFRFLTETTKNTGKFQTEVLLNSEINYKNIFSNSKLIKKDLSYVLKCKNCLNELSYDQKFQRVLPLPSDSVEPAEWFCHKHGETELNLEPKLSDCFYLQSKIHINSNIIKNIKTVNQILLCNKCYNWLGLNSKETTKLWLNTVTLTSLNEIISSESKYDFISTVKNCINECMLGFTKLILETPNLNGKVDYLSIWILEKRLKLYVKKENANFSEIEVAKVLFRFDSDFTDLLTSWLNDVKVNQIKISKPMMVSGLNHLYEMSKMIPGCYSKSNDFFVSYLTL